MPYLDLSHDGVCHGEFVQLGLLCAFKPERCRDQSTQNKPINTCYDENTDTCVESFDPFFRHRCLVGLPVDINAARSTPLPKMTDCFRVHEIFHALDNDGVVGNVKLIRIIPILFETFVQYLDIQTCSMISRCCKSLRPITSDVFFLEYLLRMLPQTNSEQTRHRFLIPRSKELLRLSRGSYSQSHSLHLALQKYGNLDGFRAAVEKRREMLKVRRKRIEDRELAVYISRTRRAKMLRDAVDVLGLPVESHLFNATALLFMNNVPPIPQILEENRLARIMETMCWLYYLRTYTGFHEQCETRLEIMGDYPGLERDISLEYEKPSVWPWLV